MNSNQYINDILFEHVALFLSYRPYVIIDQYLNEEIIEALSWPLRSCDLNRIERLWEILNRQLQFRNLQLSS